MLWRVYGLKRIDDSKFLFGKKMVIYLSVGIFQYGFLYDTVYSMDIKTIFPYFFFFLVIDHSLITPVTL